MNALELNHAVNDVNKPTNRLLVDSRVRKARVALLANVKPSARVLDVGSVSPGTLLKESNKMWFEANVQTKKRLEAITPLRRMGTAREVSTVIRFLLGPDASFITGQDIVIDGGVGLCAHESLVSHC